MSLSYGSKFGYYGLRVNPTLEQVVGTVRNPLKIPLPDRKAKWYANSPYRALILDAEERYQNYERAAIDYRLTGADAPESATRVRASDAGGDEKFDRIDDHNRLMEEHEAIDTARGRGRSPLHGHASEPASQGSVHQASGSICGLRTASGAAVQVLRAAQHGAA